MGFSCAAKFCQNKSYICKKSFFRFPVDPIRARTWAFACNREDLLDVVNTLNKSHRICQDHFELNMFTNDQCNRLNPNAVPTLFPLQEGSSRGPNFDHTYTPLYDLKSLDKSEKNEEKNMQRKNILQDMIITAEMNHSSDSESGDSDRGIRYKTESTRSSQDFENDETNEVKSFGPALPPNYQKNVNISIGPELPSSLKITDFKTENKTIGPELPPNFQNHADVIKSIGPALPPHMLKKLSPEITNLVPNEAQAENLSSLSQKSSNENMVGPVLPPHLLGSVNHNIPQCSNDSSENKHIGPILPDHLKHQPQSTEELDEEVYGPLPDGFNQSKAHMELEERALQMKINMLNPMTTSEPTREEWMLELPAVKAANLGLGPRQFRAKEAPDLTDRSSWTDTPEDRAKKKEKKNKEEVDVKKDAELKEMKKRDKEQEDIAKKCKRSKESLVDMHRKKMKKKKEDDPIERRPFSREVDLQVNRFDEARKKAVLKKAQLLDTRFSAGHSKFL